MSSNTIRFTGINSGYDTEAMIEQMMSSYQTKIDNQQKKLTKLSWKQDAYRDITTKLTDFKNKYFDILNKKTYLMTPSAFSKFNSTITTKADGDKASGLSVTTTSGSVEGNYKLKLSKLASAATAKGSTIKPESFSLNLDTAADESFHTKETADDGSVTRKYSFSLDVQVGGVTKTVSFDVSAAETDGKIDKDAFRADALSALNTQLQEAFGYSGRTGSDAAGAVDASGKEWFIQAEAGADGKITFAVGGNAAASITEKDGVFGLAAKSSKLAVSAQSAVTGTNTVSVNIGGVTKNVSFEGVASTYYDSKDKEGNESVLAEYNELKLAAYRKDKKLSGNAAVTQEQLDNYTYTGTQAAKDKNAAALKKALNDNFAGEGITFSIDNSYITAKKGSEEMEFSMTTVEGGTLGLTKGTSSNKFSAKTKLKDMGIEADADGKYVIKINDKEISLDKDAAVSDLMSAVNKSGAGVTMTYSVLTNSFGLTSNNMGSAESISIGGSDITKALGLTDDSGNVLNYTRGENSVFELNGVEIYHNSNSYTTDGTTFEFGEDMTVGETYTVGITKSYDDIKQTIKDFVSDYNQLISDVYDQIGTSPKRDDSNNTYEPLTDAEKEEMSDDEVEKWEKYAKQGVLYNDSTVSGIMSKMRTVLYNSVTLDDGSRFGLYSMGIKTSTDYTEHGKLEIDEDAFDKAFSENPEAVMKLFTDSNGIMQQANKVLDDAVRTTSTNRGSLIKKAGLESGSSSTDNEIYKQMKNVQERISSLQDKYDSKEEYWWNVFTNLESMMSDLNSQSSYLSSYFGTGSST